MKPFGLSCFIFACSLMIGGCAGHRPGMPPLASVEGVPGHFAEGRIVDLNEGKSISFEQLISNLEAIDLIFVGEVHDNPEHHLMEVQILQALTARYGPLTVAMEFFDVTQQPILDQYMERAIPEDQFLKDADWIKGWSFPYHFYRPLLLAAREAGDRLIGINAPAGVVRKVARSGLESLTPEERGQAAREIDLDNEAHRQYLNKIFQEHSHEALQNVDYFYEAQCVWEETMAQNIARDLKEVPRKMVVFAGNGHIVNRFGIPDRVLRRIPVTMATILLYPLTERTILFKNMADYIWLTGGCAAGGHGRQTMRLRRPGEDNENEINTGKDR
jgi:uncharacterized iron-regulated protein